MAKEIWKGKPPEHRWAVLQATKFSNGNVYLALSRQLTGEKLPEMITITLPADCLQALGRYLIGEDEKDIF